jgi:hypothetical protein
VSPASAAPGGESEIPKEPRAVVQSGDALPLYLVTRAWTRLVICAGVIAASSLLLKFSWLDRLAADEVDRESEAAD